MLEQRDRRGVLGQSGMQAQRFAMAAPTGQLGRIDGVEFPVRRKQDQLVGRLALDREQGAVAFLEGNGGYVVTMTLERPYPALVGNNGHDRLAHNQGFGHGIGAGLRRIAKTGPALAERRTRPEFFADRLDFTVDLRPLLGLGTNQGLQARALVLQAGFLGPDCQLFQLAQGAQAHIQNRFGLTLGEREGRHQRLLGFVLEADNPNDFVEIGIDDDIARQHFEPVFDLGQARLGAAHDNHTPVIDPLAQRLFQADDTRRPGPIQHIEIERDPHFQLGQLEQRFHQHRRRHQPRFRLDDDAQVLRRLVAHIVKQRNLFRLDQLGDALDQFRFLDLIRNLVDDEPPFAAGIEIGIDLRRPHVLEIDRFPFPAKKLLGTPGRAQAEAAPPRLIGLTDRGAWLHT